jgi:hypothetical protein
LGKLEQKQSQNNTGLDFDPKQTNKAVRRNINFTTLGLSEDFLMTLFQTHFLVNFFKKLWV